MTALPPASADPPLLLTIRFSTSIPDLDLDTPAPSRTTVLSLKHLLRTRLGHSRNRLRLIHQGRILPDASALSAVLKPLAPPPDDADDAAPSRARAKAKAVDAAPPRIYVNCSIGDELPPEDLAHERAAAHDPPVVPVDAPAASRAAWFRPRPRGFDRLLQAGFTSSEISTLRTQFASIHTERFAPDAMPSPDSLRALEDSWIDSNAGELPSAANPLEEDLSSMSTVLDILIRGMMIGFFFPLGSLTWLLRQGVWSDKWQIFVGSGVVLSLTVGVVMAISGEH
ncbi:hypothetical protein G6O67_007800 [Ophiocordyceps sinensis]|uniref:Ubiquitin-like domain-containing protein n=1 Tax=Ophiocordyceps sinensis TaxID=72228 RepID=A0A8H4PLL3_9HYPO|nr:hypothetical protein G6O67_007800 [Ophiocordyceps sinensis]